MRSSRRSTSPAMSARAGRLGLRPSSAWRRSSHSARRQLAVSSEGQVARRPARPRRLGARGHAGPHRGSRLQPYHEPVPAACAAPSALTSPWVPRRWVHSHGLRLRTRRGNRSMSAPVAEHSLAARLRAGPPCALLARDDPRAMPASRLMTRAAVPMTISRTRCGRSPWTPSRRPSPAIPGMPMGMADVATVLFTAHLKFDPQHPTGPTATASCCRPGTARCCSTRCCI